MPAHETINKKQAIERAFDDHNKHSFNETDIDIANRRIIVLTGQRNYANRRADDEYARNEILEAENSELRRQVRELNPPLTHQQIVAAVNEANEHLCCNKYCYIIFDILAIILTVVGTILTFYLLYLNIRNSDGKHLLPESNSENN